MNNISFDTNSFSEQLGIYDFFNVILAGTIFVCGCCAISSNFTLWLLNDMSFYKGLGVILVIYIIGMGLQELGSMADRKYFNIYRGMSHSILKGKFDNEFDADVIGGFIKNPIILKQYRKTADELMKEMMSVDDREFDYENEYFSGAIFSVAQYYVSVMGKDKKVEKMRALFAMSKTLIVCFLAPSLLTILSIIFMPDSSLIPNFPVMNCEQCSGKMVLLIVFLFVSLMFYFRAKRTMRNFLLILLGTYDALIRSENTSLRSFEA